MIINWNIWAWRMLTQLLSKLRYIFKNTPDSYGLLISYDPVKPFEHERLLIKILNRLYPISWGAVMKADSEWSHYVDDSNLTYWNLIYIA